MVQKKSKTVKNVIIKSVNKMQKKEIEKDGKEIDKMVKDSETKQPGCDRTLRSRKRQAKI